MQVIDMLDYLAKGGRKDYLHTKGKENIKTTNLQNLLDEVSQRATERALERLRETGNPENHSSMKRLEEKFKNIK